MDYELKDSDGRVVILETDKKDKPKAAYTDMAKRMVNYSLKIKKNADKKA